MFITFSVYFHLGPHLLILFHPFPPTLLDSPLLYSSLLYSALVSLCSRLVDLVVDPPLLLL